MNISNPKTKAMAMWGNHIQRVKIVINDNIIERVTDFKYLEYCISEYKSDLADKLQTCNKINGAIWRHFGKQINPYPTAFPYGKGMVLHFYQQQESSTTKTVYKVINKRLKTYI